MKGNQLRCSFLIHRTFLCRLKLKIEMLLALGERRVKKTFRISFKVTLESRLLAMILCDLLFILQFLQSSAKVEIHDNRNVSQMAIGEFYKINSYNNQISRFASTALSEISRGFEASGPITILNTAHFYSHEFTELLIEIHRFRLQTYIFNKTSSFFDFIDMNLKGSLEVKALVFENPHNFIPKVSFF